MRLYSKIIPSSLQAAEEGIAELLAYLDDGISRDKLFDIRLVLNELVVNCIEHGNQFNIEKTIQINMWINQDQVEIRIKDQGPGIVPCKNPCLEDLKESGRGLFIVSQLTDKVVINKNEIHCTITT